MKKAYISAQLSDGKLAMCEFVSDQPWIPFNARDVIDPNAVAVKILKVEMGPVDGIAPHLSAPDPVRENER